MNTISQILVTADKTDVIQAVCAIIVAVIALTALFSWRSQKRFEAIVELLSKTDKARQYIMLLRSYDLKKTHYTDYLEVHSELRTREFSDIYKKRAYWNEMSLKLKEPELSLLLDVVVDMRTKAWVMFGKNDGFYRFYDEILSIKNRVYTTHMTMGFVLKRQSEPRLTSEEKESLTKQEDIFHEIIYYSPINDTYMGKIDAMILKLEEKRPLFFWSSYEEDNYTNY